MVVIAGPPGSGKTTLLPASTFGVDYFNADDRAAALNHGSYSKIGPEIRKTVGAEFEAWVTQHISSRKSFALETTLRSLITFEQARRAREAGFRTILYYISAGSVRECIKRILQRSYRGGHSASERLVGDIYKKSTHNLIAALDFGEGGFEIVRIYDNSRFNGPATEVVAFRRGQSFRISKETPPWLEEILARRKGPSAGHPPHTHG